MEEKIPEWLTDEFLTECFEKQDHEPRKGVKIISYKVTAGVPAGNNYGSQILRVNVNYTSSEDNDQEQCDSLIIKAPITSTMIEFVSAFYEFAEPNFYYKFLPKLKEMIKTEIAPKSYFSCVKNVIVLEDLKSKGFSMVDKNKQLDFDHCKLYFEASAKLHAGGIALVKQHPEFITMFPNMQAQMMQDENNAKVMQLTITSGLTCLVQSIQPLNSSKVKPYIDLISRLLDSNGELMNLIMMNGMEQQKDHLKSIIHADCWTTNMMFGYNQSGDPETVKLLDFQISNFDAVASDVLAFTWMSANNDVLENRLEELYKFYCDTLNSTLASLNCTERLSYQRLKKEILDRSLQVLIMIGVFLPFTQSKELLDDSTLFSKDVSVDKMMKYYQGEHFFNKFPLVLELAAKEGVFDWLEEQCKKKES